MKRIGIVGGLSPESTMLYYEHIVRKYYEMKHDYNFPEIIIYSLSFGVFSEAMKKDKKKAMNEILKALNYLKNAGADFAIISANTPHIFFNELKNASPLEIISIIDATIERAKKHGMKKLLLLGTMFTMESDYFIGEYEKSGISIVVPDRKERETINNIIFKELAKGVVNKESKQKLVEIIKNYDVDAVILGCTELPLILKDDEINVPLLNTATIHAEKALEYAMA